MKLKPLQDRIVVKRIEEDAKTKSGIIIPDTAKEKTMQGKVLDSVASLLITTEAMVVEKPKKKKSTPMYPEAWMIIKNNKECESL